jgi:predicted kinase
MNYKAAYDRAFASYLRNSVRSTITTWVVNSLPRKQALVLVRGVSGAGKSTNVRAIQAEVWATLYHYEADMYFVHQGVYKFDASKLTQAHARCMASTRSALNSYASVLVSNTLTTRWEMEPYLRMAFAAGVPTYVIDLFDGGCTDEELHARNVHGVPLAAIRAMRARYESNWRVGSPLPPWERSKHVEG